MFRRPGRADKSFSHRIRAGIDILGEWALKLAFGFEAMSMQKSANNSGFRYRFSLQRLSLPFRWLPNGLDAGVTDNEIRIGNIMPYTGPLAAFAHHRTGGGRYFDMVNERGGINGRKIKFISLDDGSIPKPRSSRRMIWSRSRTDNALDVRLVRHAEQPGDAALSE